MSTPSNWGASIAAVRSLNFIKTKNTGGTVEVHSVGSNTSYGTVLHAVTNFSLAEAQLGTFLISTNGEGESQIDYTATLNYIKTAGTGGGKVELHTVNQRGDPAKGEWYSSWRNPIHHYSTCLGVQGVPFGAYQMDRTDLAYIKTKDTSSGFVEVYVTQLGSNYQQLAPWSGRTGFSVADALNGQFFYRYGWLYFVKYKNCGSNMVEIHSQVPGDGTNPITHYATGWNMGEAGIGSFALDFEWIEVLAAHEASLFLVQNVGSREDRVTLHIARRDSGFSLAYAEQHNDVLPYIEKPRMPRALGDWNFLYVRPPYPPDAVFGFDTPFSVAEWPNGIWQVANAMVLPEYQAAPPPPAGGAAWTPGQLFGIGVDSGSGDGQ